jgi:hypothetical protein
MQLKNQILQEQLYNKQKMLLVKTLKLQKIQKEQQVFSHGRTNQEPKITITAKKLQVKR